MTDNNSLHSRKVCDSEKRFAANLKTVKICAINKKTSLFYYLLKMMPFLKNATLLNIV